MDDINPATSLKPCDEDFLRKLLRRYPKGNIWHVEDLSSAEDSEETTSSAASDAASDAPDERSRHRASRRKKGLGKPTLAARLATMFPGACCIAFFPLWDTYRDRWFAGAFAYSLSPLRELTIEDELSYLAAFGNSIMTEVSRADTLKNDKAKTDFISSISHELRSPLHGILGSAEMLRESVLKLRQNELLQNIETCGRTLLDTFDHLLDFTKINHFATSKRLSGPSLQADQDTDESNRLSSRFDLNLLCEEAFETMFAGHNFTNGRRPYQGQHQGE